MVTTASPQTQIFWKKDASRVTAQAHALSKGYTTVCVSVPFQQRPRELTTRRFMDDYFSLVAAKGGRQLYNTGQ